MNERCDLAMIGLGVMGANFARNLAARGRRVAIFDREPKTTRALVERHPEARFVPCDSIGSVVAALARPRVLLLLVPAGAPVDEAIATLAPHLEADDIVVDAGNSDYRDTDRRIAAAAGRAWHFVGMGVSGGSEGALTGPSLMPGGTREAYARLEPLLAPSAAVADGEACLAWCGHGSAGHFVKMVHNGIEYGDMQLIAEIAFLMRRGLGWSAERCAQAFERWNAAELESYLIELTAKILREPDPQNPNALLLDAILDRAGQKGTGRWTIEAAVGLGVAIPTIAAAVDARIQSAALETRIRASALFEERAGSTTGTPPPRPAFRSAELSALSESDLRDALLASKIASYSQGFELLARGSEVHRHATDLARVARLWKAGCIIRARFLDDVARAYGSASTAGSAPLLALTPAFVAALRERASGWRRVVSAATAAGVPVPGLAASLSWFDTLRTRRGSADLIQAQRDAFGGHGYERVDAVGKPGQAV